MAQFFDYFHLTGRNDHIISFFQISVPDLSQFFSRNTVFFHDIFIERSVFFSYRIDEDIKDLFPDAVLQLNEEIDLRMFDGDVFDLFQIFVDDSFAEDVAEKIILLHLLFFDIQKHPHDCGRKTGPVLAGSTVQIDR